MQLPAACVLDASIVIKLFVDEHGSDVVRHLLRAKNGDRNSLLLVPDLLFVECANILWKKVRRKRYPEDLAARCLSRLRSLGLTSTPTGELMERALEIACGHGITAYDACYVALAELAGVSLLTADDQLAAALADTPFDVLSLIG